MNNINDKTEQIVNACYNAGWDGCWTAQELAAEAAKKARKEGLRSGRRKGFLLGAVLAILGTSAGIAYKEGAFDGLKIPNLFKKKENDLDDFEVDEFDDAN